MIFMKDVQNMKEYLQGVLLYETDAIVVFFQGFQKKTKKKRHLRS